ncbi:MAG: M28 family peptidase [Coriobacteriia bacterium]|nr:M28 family peptidase [Coriobacteriia bacterium]MBN2840712.1 M28 family peptidase [Coriobacteriia bacterium]
MRVRRDVLAAFTLALVAVAGALMAWRLSEARSPGTATGSIAASGTAPTLQPLDTTPTVEPAAIGLADGIDAPAGPLQPTPVELPEFDEGRALRAAGDLEALGPRGGGSDAEAKAAEYLRDRLVQLGLDARVEEFALPDGATSRNVVARIAGSTDRLFVLGAHMDTKPPSPGANDNASGCGALLEIARLLAADPPVTTVEIVFFGSEETIGSDPNAHHFGSRYRVSQMSEAERMKTAGMISIDMIGYGPEFHSRTMGRGPMVLSDMLLARARTLGIRMTYRKDPGASGWSDHEAYELAGLPVAWLEWRDDPAYHTAGDTSGRLSGAKIATAGRLILEFMRGLDAAALGHLAEG